MDNTNMFAGKWMNMKTRQTLEVVDSFEGPEGMCLKLDNGQVVPFEKFEDYQQMGECLEDYTQPIPQQPLNLEGAVNSQIKYDEKEISSNVIEDVVQPIKEKEISKDVLLPIKKTKDDIISKILDNINEEDMFKIDINIDWKASLEPLQFAHKYLEVSKEEISDVLKNWIEKKKIIENIIIEEITKKIND